LDVYVSGVITKEEFARSRSKCEEEIADLRSLIDSVDRQRSLAKQENELMEEVEKAVREVMGGVEYENVFYRQILDKMVIHGYDRVDVFLHSLPFRWSYTIARDLND
jgi:dsDNA-specific endonuclease/ATPase MutS2